MTSISDQKTNRKANPFKRVYTFYGVIIALCVLALFAFHLNLFAKAVLCSLIFLCFCVIRSIRKGLILPPDFDAESSAEETSMSGTAVDTADADVEEAEIVETETVDESADTVTPSICKDSAVDTYLTLLIETDSELSSDPSVDTSSPSYNMLLNHRISEKLDAMKQSKNHSDKL